MLQTADLILENAAQIATLAGGPGPRVGAAMREARLVEGGSVAIHGGAILAVGTTREIRKHFRARRKWDASGKTIVPGFVDPHTHPVFFGTREGEFVARIEGKSYLEIAAAGGGILSSVKGVRAASRKELTQAVRLRLDRFLALGTTTLEAKSGYGLTPRDELKSLEALRDAAKGHALEVLATFLGAHEYPPEFRGEKKPQYVRLLRERMLPEVAKRKLAVFCDVFCEKGVFELVDSKAILESGRSLGLRPRVHADEIFPLGGAELAAELGAASADHLVQISARGIARLREAGVVAVLLPGTSYTLRLEKDAPARALIDAGVAVAIGTDFNPGTCYTQSMPAILNLACVRLRMTPEEALAAATINAAHSLGLSHRIGSIETSKQADLLVCDVPNLRHLAYEFGRNPVELVVKKGKIVHKRKDSA